MKPSIGLGGTPLVGFGGSTVGTTSAAVSVTSTGQVQSGAEINKSAAGSTSGGLKETNIPKELVEDIENFKRFVKEEKSVSSDIAHVSHKAHQKIKTEIKALNTIVKELSSGVAKQKIQVEKLKKESALEMQNVEIAQVHYNIRFLVLYHIFFDNNLAATLFYYKYYFRERKIHLLLFSMRM